MHPIEDEEGSDYSLDLDSDSDLGSEIYYFSPAELKAKKPVTNYVSLPRLRNEYHPNMDLNSKILLFFYAVEEEDIPFMGQLLGAGVPINCRGRDGWTPLMKACLDGKHLAVEFLLQEGSHPNVQSELFTPLMACCTRNSAPEENKLACVNLLLQYNADVNMNDKYRTTPLMHAASSGYLLIVDRLFQEKGLLHEIRDFDGWNAVFHAVSNYRTDVVLALIEYGMDYKLKDFTGRTPIDLAEERCFTKLTSIFAKLTNNPEREDEYLEARKIEENPYYYFLKELPNEDGEGGFTTDTENVLAAYGYKKLKKIPFADFLNMNENDLRRVGIRTRCHRVCILSKVIHRYHRCPWSKESLNAKVLEVPMELEDAICTLGTVAKHLTLAKASLRYFESRIDRRVQDPNLSLQAETIREVVLIKESSEKIKMTIERLIKLSKRVGAYEIHDLIPPQQENENAKSKTIKRGLIIVGASTAGYFIYNFGMKIVDFVKGFLHVKNFNSQ